MVPTHWVVTSMSVPFVPMVVTASKVLVHVHGCLTVNPLVPLLSRRHHQSLSHHHRLRHRRHPRLAHRHHQALVLPRSIVPLVNML